MKSAAAYAKHTKAIGVCYDLFRQLLDDEPQVQWDRIIKEVHKKDPCAGLDGVKRKGLCMKTLKLLKDCIMFHKLTVFNCDTAEHQKAYMMGSLKKLHQLTIQKHLSRCEVINGYITHLPTLQDSSLAVASTKKGNTVQQGHIGWYHTGYLSQHGLEEPVQDESQDRSKIDKINAPQSREH